MRLGLLIADDALSQRVRRLIESMGPMTCVIYPSSLAAWRSMRTLSPDVLVVQASRNGVVLGSIQAWREGHVGLATRVLALVESGLLDNGPLLSPGVSDFVVMPCSNDEIKVRLKRLLRIDAAPQSLHCIRLGSFTFDRSATLVTREGQPVLLTAREFGLVWLLACNAGKFVSRKQIAETVWGTSMEVADRTIETHVYRIRRKMFGEGFWPLALRTVYALGYQLDLHENPPSTRSHHADELASCRELEVMPDQGAAAVPG